MPLSEASYQKLSSHVGMFKHDTNIGVISSNDGLYLIDSGQFDEEGRLLVETLSTLFPGKPIKAVIQTHSHGDHSGGSPYIKEKAKAEIWASLEDACLMEVPAAITAIYCGGRAVKEFDVPQFSPKTNVKTDRILSEEKIDLGETDLSIFFLPGHFFDQIGILVHDKTDEKKIFFLGDSFFGIELLNKTWIPFISNPKDFRSSVKLIEKTPADFYIPGHGSLCTPETLSAYAEMNIMVTHEFESLILKKINEGKNTSEELLKAIADYSEIKLKVVPFFLIRTTLNCYLSCMQREGKISCQISENRLIWKAI